RGSGLEDDRALDLVELVVDHRSHARPAGPAADLLRLRLPSAPARHDALRIATGDLLWRKDAALRAVACTALGADVHAAYQLQQLAAPPDAADQRFVPFLEEHPRAPGKRGGGVVVPGQARSEPRRERVRRLGQPDQRAGEADCLEDLRNAPLVEEEDRHSALAELAPDVCLEIREP